MPLLLHGCGEDRGLQQDDVRLLRRVLVLEVLQGECGGGGREVGRSGAATVRTLHGRPLPHVLRLEYVYVCVYR